MKKIEINRKSYDELKEALLEEMKENEKLRRDNGELIVQLAGHCGNERPPRKVLCQLPKGHDGSHQAVIYWE